MCASERIGSAAPQLFMLQVLCLLSVFFLAAGCTFQVGSVDLRLVYTPDVSKNPLDSSRVRALRLTVTGRDLEPRSVVVQPAALGGVIDDVPVGLERQVTVEGLGSRGEVVSRGVSAPFDNDGGGRTIFVYFSRTGEFSGPPFAIGDFPARFRTEATQPRFFHAASRLPSGQVLISGGALAPAEEDFTGSVTSSLRSMDLLDGFVAAFVNDGPFADCNRGICCLRAGRSFHHSLLLDDAEHVMLASGDPADREWPIELYESASSTFLGADSPQRPRTRVAAATVASSLLLAGGLEPVSGTLTADLDIYEGGKFTAYPDLLSEPRAGAVAVALATEPPAVLVIGGWKQLGAPEQWRASDAVDRVELGGAAPKVTSFRLQHARADHTAVLLKGVEEGSVLVCGGRSSTAEEGLVTSCELIDPAGTASVLSPFSVERWAHTCTVTACGQVVVAGGFASNSRQLQADSTALIFEFPNIRSQVPMISPRAGHTATLLPNGMVALVGGLSRYRYPAEYDPFPLYQYEVFNP